MRVELVRSILLALCLAVALGADPLRGADQPDDTALIRAVAEGYQNNRESFPFLTCRFTVRYGKVRSVEDALAGRWDESERRISRRSGEWVYDGGKMRCSLDHQGSAAIIGSAEEHGEERVDLRSGVSWHWLTDGSIRFRHAVDAGLSNLIGQDEVVSEWGPSLTPFSLGMMGESERGSPYAVITKGLEEGLCRYEGEHEVLGRKTLVISAGPERLFRRHYFDPERGYLAIRIDYSWDRKDPQASSRGFVTHVRKCSKGRWFPERSVRVINPDAPPGVLRGCRIIETLELDADEPPPAESFALELPDRLVVSTRSGGGPSRFRLSAPMRLDLTNLDDLLAMVVAQADRSAQVPRSPRRGVGTLWIALGIATIGLVAVAITWRIRYGKRRLARLQHRG